MVGCAKIYQRLGNSIMTTSPNMRWQGLGVNTETIQSSLMD